MADSRVPSPPTYDSLAQRAFWPLIFASVLACALLAGRIYLSHTRTYSFLLWNLFLAWIPYFCALCGESINQRHPQDWWRLLVPGMLWLVFFPNAPYIVTDFIHLRDHLGFSWWYDVGLLGAFAWTGCFLAVISLSVAQTLVRAFLGRLLSWLFVGGVIGLSGLGIYVGRFLDLNSWDLFLHPHLVLADMAHRLAHPYSHLQAYGVTLMFAAFLLICYVTFISIQGRSGTPQYQDRNRMT